MTPQEILLICLSKECDEVGQRVSKALRFTLSEVQPGQNLTNAERISQELTDLFAVAELLIELGVIPKASLREDIETKKQKTAKYLAYSKQIGVIIWPQKQQSMRRWRES